MTVSIGRRATLTGSRSSLESSIEPEVRWYERPWFRKSITIGFFLLVLIKFVHSVFFKQNDFDVHLAWGREALQGTFYGDAQDWQSVFFQYPPGRILFDELLSLLPHFFARGLVFSAAIGSLFVTRSIWRALAAHVKPAPPTVEFSASACAFILFAPWVARDFDECGLHILLLFMLSMGARSLYQGARVQAGAWIGLAISYKVTPLLFLPLLLWKRRFVEASAAIGFVIVFNFIAPVLVWGPHAAWDAVERHVRLVQTVMSREDPAENGIEPPRYGNHSLELAIARYLQTYPPGHQLFIDQDYDLRSCTERGVATFDCRAHPLFKQFFALSPATAKRIIVIMILTIAIGMAWAMRRKWLLAKTPRRAAEYSSLAPEWAVASVFAAILSPLTWAQHLVLILPCGYLVIRDLLLRDDQLRVRWLSIGLMFVFVWILKRDMLPMPLYVIVGSYYGDVLAMLILVVLTLTIQGAIVPAIDSKREGIEINLSQCVN